MHRAEIIANQSVQDDILEALEENVPEILYTVVPSVQGRGGENRKLGTTTWPETNFLVISYIEDDKVPAVKAVIKAVKEKFKNEGIKLFFTKAES
ncbi:hypothetical protein HRI96_10870 [Treponema parvum]|uniref:Nitrogen regulatory protein P-II n=1 Tax=Treponema parvum TaxID=138851 RepID=A0A975IDS7_9SPIR|nr:PG0541 family transporter-associated protein [Treponema parvum]QTQ12656.1 hypothetical protein HRI96_10870 [Treponema parvum]QTQ13123.1 hypothetical protein HRQ91_00895 [Treponema parvum]